MAHQESPYTVLYGQSSRYLKEAGDLVMDRFGLETGSCVYAVAKSLALAYLPPKGWPHPYANYLKLVRRRTVLSAGIANIICDFEGCSEESEPEYELVIGTTEEPIQTHPRFTQYIGGTAAAPLNGAVFLDADGEVATGNSATVKFDHFSAFKIVGYVTGAVIVAPNELAGLEAYLDGAHAVWTQTFVTPNTPQNYNVGSIMNPPGPVPNYPGRSWLYIGLNDKLRGGAHFVQRQWLLSGPRGWSPIVYPTSY